MFALPNLQHQKPHGSSNLHFPQTRSFPHTCARVITRASFSSANAICAKIHISQRRAGFKATVYKGNNEPCLLSTIVPRIYSVNKQ